MAKNSLKVQGDKLLLLKRFQEKRQKWKASEEIGK